MKLKFIWLFLFILNFSSLLAQEIEIPLVGQGSNIEEARSNALKSALIQALGAYITSKVEIIADTIVRDEISLISNGSITSYKIIEEGKINEQLYFSNLIAKINKGHLISFSKSKGIKVEYEGQLYAENIRVLDINAKAEEIAWKNMKEILQLMLSNCVQYKLNISNPVYTSGDKYKIPVELEIHLDNGYDSIINVFKSFCKSINLNKGERYEGGPSTNWRITKLLTLAQPLMAISKPIFPLVFSVKPIDLEYYTEISTGRKQKIYPSGGYGYSEEPVDPYFSKIPSFYFENEMMLFRSPIVAEEILQFQFKYLHQIIANAQITTGQFIYNVGSQNIEEINDFFSADGVWSYMEKTKMKMKERASINRSIPWLVLTNGQYPVNFDYISSVNRFPAFFHKSWVSKMNSKTTLSDNFELMPILNFLKPGKLFHIKLYLDINLEQLNKIKGFKIIPPKIII
jgi:hypothetical protein